jgi:hypothetical protein
LSALVTGNGVKGLIGPRGSRIWVPLFGSQPPLSNQWSREHVSVVSKAFSSLSLLWLFRTFESLKNTTQETIGRHHQKRLQKSGFDLESLRVQLNHVAPIQVIKLPYRNDNGDELCQVPRGSVGWRWRPVCSQFAPCRTGAGCGGHPKKRWQKCPLPNPIKRMHALDGTHLHPSRLTLLVFGHFVRATPADRSPSSDNIYHSKYSLLRLTDLTLK